MSTEAICPNSKCQEETSSNKTDIHVHVVMLYPEKEGLSPSSFLFFP